MTARGLLLLALAAAACSRSGSGASGGPDAAPASPSDPAAPAQAPASASVSASASASASATAAASVLRPTRVSPAEARRSRLARIADDPSLGRIADVVEKHFAGEERPVAFEVQSAELSLGRRRALLVLEAGKPTSQARPMAIVVDEAGKVVWTKEHPVAGILAPVGPIAIAGGPLGRVALAACDPPTRTAALRIWDEDGSPFADFQVLDVETCDAISLLYWPRHGWIVVAVAPDTTRARLITEEGSLRWGRGLDLGARSRSRAIAPASLAVDAEDSFVLVQAAQPTAAAGTPFHALAFRYDSRGAAIWPAAVDLGELPRPPASGERLTVTPAEPAGVRVTGPDAFDVDVRPSGDVTRRRGPP